MLTIHLHVVDDAAPSQPLAHVDGAVLSRSAITAMLRGLADEFDDSDPLDQCMPAGPR